jgi:hypothetical protein
MATKAQKEKAKKVVAARNRQIAKDNAAFEKMTPSEKRVTIARDVIAQLAVGRLVATTGLWLASPNGMLFDDSDAEKDLELQAVLKKTKTCEGCAMGGLFMCAVERANKLKVSELVNVDTDEDGESFVTDGEVQGDDAFSYLKRFFSKGQLEMIETAFEQGGGATSAGFESESFAENVEDPGERMRLIMENIVVNKGKFVPHKTPVMIWSTPGYKG